MNTASRLPAARLIARAAGAGLLAAGLLAAAPARAEDVTAEQAGQLAQQIHDWLAALLGPKANIGDEPVQVVAEDDHYRFELPLAGSMGKSGVALEAEPLTAAVKPLDGGRWSIDDFKIPSPMKLTLPTPGGTGGTTVDTITIASQSQHGVLDPTLATPSMFEGTLKGYKTESDGGAEGGKRTTHIDEIVTHLSWQPAADGRIDILEDADSKALTTEAAMPNVGPVTVAIGQVHVVAHLDGVAPDRAGIILHAIFDALPTNEIPESDQSAGDAPKTPDGTPPAAPSGKMTPAQHAIAHKALVAVTELIGGLDEQITLHNVRVNGAGHDGGAKKVVFGMGFGVPNGKLGMHLNFALDGFSSADIPPGPFHDYIPRHIAFSPRVGGVPADDVKALLLRAADSEGDDPGLQAQAEALLSKGPVVIGLDDVALEAGPASLKASGEMHVISKEDYSGQAHITITGFDDLIKQSGTVPEFQQAAPVLIFLKGVGKQNGNVMVWDISYAKKKLIVNGNDMSQMIPGGGQ